MDGPERLEVGGRPSRARTRVVVAFAVLVVGALGVVRLTGLPPHPAPASPTSAPSGTLVPRVPWPRGMTGGTLYVLDAGGVVAVDVGTGLVQRSRLSVDPASVTLTAGGQGVLVWFENGTGTPRLVTPGLPAPPTVAGWVAEAEAVLPGPGTAVWASSEVPGDGARSTWRLVDEDHSVLETVRLHGFVGTDGSGGLFALEDDRVRHVVPGQAQTTWTGQVMGVGPDGYEALRCVGRRCAVVLHDRGSGTETPIAATHRDGEVAAMSPANRFEASLEPLAADVDGPYVVRVRAPGAQRELRSIPVPQDGSTALAWVSDRWLVVSGVEGLTLYDAVEDRLVAPDLGVSRPTQLVFRPA